MKKIISFVLILAMLSVSLTACKGEVSGDERDCKKLITDFETALNDGDADAILDCINPDISTTLKKVLDTFNTGKEKIISIILDFLNISITSEQEEEVKEDVDNIKITPQKYELEETSGTVLCNMEIKAGKTTIKRDVTFKVIKKEETWYIGGVK